MQSDADALSEKISARLSKDDKREFYVAVKGLLNAEPVPSKDAKLSRSKISEGRARGLIKVSVNGKPKEQKAKFALEDAEWRVTHLSDR